METKVVEVVRVVVDKLKARALMTRCVKTVRIDSSFDEALEIMSMEGFSQLPVMDGTKPVALLTEADLRRALLENRRDRPVGELASPLPTSLSPEARLSVVLQALEGHESILVISPRGRLRGIITYWDVLVLSRPYLFVTESELLLRQVVSKAFTKAYGPDWWDQVPDDIRRTAEEEHRHDDGEQATPEHMLGHTSFYQLIKCYQHVWPEIPAQWVDNLHQVRMLRNRVAHHYRIDTAEERELIRRCSELRDWLEAMLKSY